MTPKEQRFNVICRGMIAIGIKPTPMNVRAMFPNEKFVNMPTAPHRGPMFSGSLSAIRREAFINAGWRQEYEGATWRPPS